MTTARLIIQLHSRKFTHFVDEAQIELSEVRLDLRCKSDNHNELIISGFSHQKEALIYLDKLRLAFFFMMLDDDIIVDACLDAEEAQLHSNVENGCTFRSAKETLENPGHPRDNSPVITGMDWVDGRQAAWFW